MTDEELMAAVCQGDQSAYQTLVRQHFNAISHYVFRLLGNRGDTEDITQEVFLKLWLNATQWQPEKSRLSTWLHRIAHNLSIDFLRKHSRMSTESELTTESGSATITDSVVNDAAEADTTVEKNSRMQWLLLNLQQLPEAQRSAIMLCHYSGFSNQEAADIMSLSVKALESLLARARRSLRDKLGADQSSDKVSD